MRWMLAAALLLAPFQAPAQDEAAEPAQAFEALEAEYKKASAEWMANYRVLAKEGDEEKLREFLKEPRAEKAFLPRFAKEAEAHAGTKHAPPFLAWIVSNGYSDRKRMLVAAETLVNEHIECAEMRLVASRLGNLGHKDKAKVLLERIASQNPDANTQAQALFTLAQMSTGTRGSGATDEERALGLVHLETAFTRAAEEGLKKLIAGAINEEKNLGIGRVAPDIEGEDLDGVEFKLSDYRGKVIMLDFWGDW